MNNLILPQNETKLCIPFRIWESANLAAAKDDPRYYLKGVHIKGNRVEATNGHIAYMASLKDFELPECAAGCSPIKLGFIVSPKNKIPKWSKKNPIAYVVITVNEKDADISYLSHYGERLSSDIANVIDGKFPNIPKLISTARRNPVNNQLPIGVNTKYLDLPNKMLSHCKWPIVKMELFGVDIAILFTLKREGLHEVKETLVIMPARL